MIMAKPKPKPLVVVIPLPPEMVASEFDAKEHKRYMKQVAALLSSSRNKVKST